MNAEITEEYEELRDRLLDLPTEQEINEYYISCKGHVSKTATRILSLLPEVLHYCENAFGKIPFKAPEDYPLPELPFKTGTKKMDFILLAYWTLSESRTFTYDYLKGDDPTIEDSFKKDYLSGLRYGSLRLSPIRRQYPPWCWEGNPFYE